MSEEMALLQKARAYVIREGIMTEAVADKMVTDIIEKINRENEEKGLAERL